MNPHRFAIRTYEGVGFEPLAAFIDQYRQAFPDAKLMSPGFYIYHPLLEGGRNVFGAFEGQRLVGFAPVSPAPAMEESPPDALHHIWTIIIALPDLPEADDVRDSLLDRVVERARGIKATFSPRATRLASDLMISQQPDVRYLLARGFVEFDGLYVLRRALADPIPAVTPPDALTIRHWKMPTEAEQRDYLEALNSCFPGDPKTWESWQFFVQSPLWEAGSAIAAFDRQDRLVGSILVYWDEAHQHGITDDVFVLPEWRGRGVAKCLIGEGLRYLREQGAAQVVLEVRRENVPALSVYQAMGYEQVNEEVMLGLLL